MVDGGGGQDEHLVRQGGGCRQRLGDEATRLRFTLEFVSLKGS